MSVFLDTFVISFYISFAGIIGMLGLKVLENRSGKKSWITRIADKTNHTVHHVYDRLKLYISYINRKSAIALIQWIAYHILSWARETYIWAYRKAHAHAPSKKVIDMVRGKGEVNKNGGSSFYFKSISTEDEVEEVKKK